MIRRYIITVSIFTTILNCIPSQEPASQVTDEDGDLFPNPQSGDNDSNTNPTVDKSPNVIFIFADDLGYADLKSYGHPYARTPNIDKLAQEGTRFERFYVTGVTCSPSRTGFMTGRFPARFSKKPKEYGFGDRKTVTELFRQKGYLVGHFGKWHIGPNKGEGYGIHHFDGGGQYKIDSEGKDSGLFNAAIDFIKKNANKDKPLYLNIWGHISHFKLNPPVEMVNEFNDIDFDRNDFSSWMQKKFDDALKDGSHSLKKCMQHYLAEVYSLDKMVGKLMEAIDEAGISDNTIVVFSSDQGPDSVVDNDGYEDGLEFMLGYAGIFRGGKHEEYEGGVRVPFIVWWPGHVPANRVDKNVLCGVDWLPTMSSIIGFNDNDLPNDLDGENVKDVMLGKTTDYNRQKHIFWKTGNEDSKPAMVDSTGRWKLHYKNSGGSNVELYDLSNDPEEKNDLSSSNSNKVSELKIEMQKFLDSLPDDYID